MLVVLLSREVIKVTCNPEDLWSACKMVKGGNLEGFVKYGDRAVSIRRIDVKATFGDLILTSLNEVSDLLEDVPLGEVHRN